MRTTVRLNDDVMMELKHYAVRHNQTLTGVIEQALREKFLREQQGKPREWISLPTHKGSSLQPGVNLDSNAALLDLMDGIEPE